MSISGPIAYLNNVPINPEFYSPRRNLIAAITFGLTTSITTAKDNLFVVGQNVRLIVPKAFGTAELNEVEALIIEKPSNDTVVVNIDSRFLNTFIPSPSGQKTPSQIIPIGDFNSGFINNSGNLNAGTHIPGSFINISPL